MKIHKKKRIRQKKIGFKLLRIFVIEMLLGVLLGTFSYHIASNAMIEQYKNAVIDTSNAVELYAQTIFDNVESKVEDVVGNDDVIKYYTKYWDRNTGEANKIFKTAENIVSQVQENNQNVAQSYFLVKNGKTIASAALSEDITYESYEEMMSGYTAEGESAGYWYISLTALNGETGDGVLTYCRPVPEIEAYFVIEMTPDCVNTILNNISSQEDSLTEMTTSHGTAGLWNGEGSSQIRNLSLPDEDGEITYKGEEYLYLSSKIEGTEITIRSLIPKAALLGQVEQIKKITILIVALIILVSVLLGLPVSKNISREIRDLCKVLQKVAEGDFTVRYKTKSRNEFSQLSHALDGTLNNIQSIMRRIYQFNVSVNGMAETVAEKAEDLSVSMKDIGQSSDEINHGVAMQAESSEKSFEKMQSFSDRIEDTTHNLSEIKNTVTNMETEARDGIRIIDDLKQKASDTTDLTDMLIRDIQDVIKRSKDISKVVESINSIAEQTNLLALNASIEAARAGTAGKGFAVVAEEIRKLADQSVQASQEIGKIIETIQHTAERTGVSAKKTEDNIHLQNEALQETIESFGKIDQDIIDLSPNLKMINTNMTALLEDNQEILSGISNVAAASEQISASTACTVETIDKQVESIVQLSNESKELKDKTEDLHKMIKEYKFDEQE